MNADQISQLLSAIPLWQATSANKFLRREWTVKDFATALDFFQRIGAIAEAQDHHPDFHLTGYPKVASNFPRTLSMGFG